MTTASSKKSFNDILRSLTFRTHLIFSIILRLVLIIYSQIHDEIFEVSYTDIDYKVVTDASRLILKGKSPFDRHTYRYSPIPAYIHILNIFIHPIVGKFIYAAFDIYVAILIYIIVQSELQNQCRKAIESLLSKYGKRRSTQIPDSHTRSEEIAKFSAIFWLYNPLTAIISTRGNGDSFSSFFVILTIYFLSRSEDHKKSNWYIFMAGLTHGISIHLRIYPLLFSLSYFLCLSERLNRTVIDFIRQIIFPNQKQLILIFGTLISLLTLTGFFYRLYGWKFIYEAYLYHFVRKDVRHNFSLYFLMQYLSGNVVTTISEKFIIILPQIVLLIYLSFSFGQFRQTLPFCIFAQTFIIVTYNTVVTSQYFIWYLALLPLCLNNLLTISLRKASVYFLIWLTGQIMWLLPAYLLEFKTLNTFYWIGGQGILFFLINIFVLSRFIENYSFTSFKVNFKKLF